jgi:hypothetical protein
MGARCLQSISNADDRGCLVEEIHKITRAELYEKVWTIPMQKLAVEYSFSDVGLAKLCRRHQIPVPARGYWARIQYGQKPKRPTLPAVTSSSLDVIEIRPHEKTLRETPFPEGLEIPKIEVLENRPITHKDVLRIDKSVLRSKKNERGLPAVSQGRVLPIQVSLDSLPRTLRLLDPLFTAIDGEHKIEWPHPYNTSLTIIAIDEKMRFSVSEKLQRKDHKLTKDEIASGKTQSWQVPRWDFTPTGLLKCTLKSIEFSHIRQTWGDGKRQRVEHSLGEMFATLAVTANAVKKYREDRAEAERKRIEEQHREWERQRRREEYNRKAEILTKFSRSWRDGKLLREFAATLKANAESTAIPEAPENMRRNPCLSSSL